MNKYSFTKLICDLSPHGFISFAPHPDHTKVILSDLVQPKRHSYEIYLHEFGDMNKIGSRILRIDGSDIPKDIDLIGRSVALTTNSQVFRGIIVHSE